MNNDAVSDAEYTRLLNQFASVCMTNTTTKNEFVACMKSKLREELLGRYNEEEVSNKLNAYVRDIGNNSFALVVEPRQRCTGRGCTVMGGRRTLRKKRTCRKNRHLSRRR